jgi:N-acetylmuramoyl-L-alanine amidase
LVPSQVRLIIASVLLFLAVAAAGARQGPPAHAAQPLTVISVDGRRALPAVLIGDDVMVGLDDLAAIFQLSVREDVLAGGVTVTHKGKSVILTPGQPLASAAGRIVSLPCPPSRDGRRWLVPVEFISRALSVVYEQRLDVRKNSRLVLVGAVRVPRVAVREDVTGPQTRVTLAVSPRTPYTVSQNAGHILVHFDADALDVSLPTFAPQGLLQAVRAAETGAAISIDLGPRFGSYRESFVPQEGAGQVVVDLLPAAAEPSPPPSSRGGAAPLPALQPHEPSPPAPQPAAGGLRTVVIDPGHGGGETGVRGATGVLEKDITLSVARRLRALLESRLGVRVLLTRDADQAVTLDERAALANNAMADLFISLHANASLRREPSGAQIYYLSADLSGDDVRRAAAGRQTLPTAGGGSRTIEMIPWELAQLRYLSESALLAEALEERFRGLVRLNPRAIQQAPLRVLAGVNMPAVLVEIGFLTNPDEEQQLVSEIYQGTLTQALLEGVIRFRERADQARSQEGEPSPLPEPVRRRP